RDAPPVPDSDENAKSLVSTSRTGVGRGRPSAPARPPAVLTLPARRANAVRRVLAADARPGQFLPRLGPQRAAFGAALPTNDLVGLSTLLAPRLPARRPARVGVGGQALLLVPEQRLAFTVALDTQGHGRERGGAQVWRRERVALLGPHAHQVVLPQGVGVIALEAARHELAFLADLARRAARRVAAVLRQDRVTKALAFLVIEHQRRRVAADALLNAVVVAHGRGHEHLTALVVVGDDGG